MKKLELKLAGQKLTKEEMKNVIGGAICNATIICCNGSGGPQDCQTANASLDCGDTISVCAQFGFNYMVASCSC